MDKRELEKLSNSELEKLIKKYNLRPRKEEKETISYASADKVIEQINNFSITHGMPLDKVYIETERSSDGYSDFFETIIRCTPVFSLDNPKHREFVIEQIFHQISFENRELETYNKLKAKFEKKKED